MKQRFPDAWREGHRRLYVYLKDDARKFPQSIEDMTPLYAAVVHGCLAGKHQAALDEIYWPRICKKEEQVNSIKLGAFGSEAALLSAFFDPPWDNLLPGLTENSQTFIMHQAGSALRALGRLTEAMELLRMSLARSIDRGNWPNATATSSFLSHTLQIRGDLLQSLESAQQCNELANKCDDTAELIYAKIDLAIPLHALGRPKEATALFEEAERMGKGLHQANSTLDGLEGYLYCDLLLDEGRYAEVIIRASNSLISRDAQGSLLDIALSHLSLGLAEILAVQRGAATGLASATTQLQQAVNGLRRAGQQDYLPLGLLARAALCVQTRDFPSAYADLAEALSIASRGDFRLHQADAHVGYARLYLADKSPTAAREHIASARAIIDATGYHRRDGVLAELDAALVGLA